MSTNVKEVTAALQAPFEPHEVKFKPQMVKGNRALALAYVDVRGVENWQDEYDPLPDGSVVCRLRLFLGGQWITKMDVGSPSEQPDGGDRLKAAFSDALKRAAVKYGIGRYLYRLPATWAEYDPVKKQLLQLPQLPARPKPAKPAQPAPSAAPAKSTSSLPTDGADLHRRLREYDAKLAADQRCPLGALLTHVTVAGTNAGFPSDMTAWSGAAIPFAVSAVKAFEASLKDAKTAA
jgi:hypothetical protein